MQNIQIDNHNLLKLMSMNKIVLTILLGILNLNSVTLAAEPSVINTHSLPYNSLLAINNQNQSVEQKVIGQWESILLNQEKYLLIFTNKKVLYLIKTNASGQIINLVPGNYKINPTTFPINLDFTARHYSGEIQTLKTIFQFTTNDELQIDLHASADSPRPTNFPTQYTFNFTRTSYNGSLPENIQQQIQSAIKKANREAPEGLRKSRNAFAKLNISTIARAEQVFFLENQRFTNQLQKLSISLMKSEHQYKILSPETIGNKYKIVKIIAQPKLHNLDSMIAAVVAKKNRDNSYSLASITCVTRQSSRKLLAMPIFVKATGELKCPANTRAIHRS